MANDARAHAATGQQDIRQLYASLSDQKSRYGPFGPPKPVEDEPEYLSRSNYPLPKKGRVAKDRKPRPDKKRKREVQRKSDDDAESAEGAKDVDDAEETGDTEMTQPVKNGEQAAKLKASTRTAKAPQVTKSTKTAKVASIKDSEDDSSHGDLRAKKKVKTGPGPRQQTLKELLAMRKLAG